MSVKLAFFAGLIGLAGCGESAASGGIQDAGANQETDAASSPPRVEVGTGASRFEPLQTDDILTAVFGPQGGHHYFGAAKLYAVDPSTRRRFAFTVTDLDQDRVIATAERDLVPQAQADASIAIYSIQLVLEDCEPTRNARLALLVTVDDDEGRPLTDRREVQGDDRCDQ